MSNTIVVAFEDMKTINFAAINDGYNPIGALTAFFEHPIRQLLVNNMTNAALVFSTDGVNNKFSLPANSYAVLDITANKTVPQGGFLPERTRIFVKNRYLGVDPTSGDVDITALYGKDN